MRYIAKSDPTGEWGVYDTHKRMFVATGLTQGEAEVGASNRNTAYHKLINGE
jgi:hypothetical protein